MPTFGRYFRTVFHRIRFIAGKSTVVPMVGAADHAYASAALSNGLSSTFGLRTQHSCPYYVMVDSEERPERAPRCDVLFRAALGALC